MKVKKYEEIGKLILEINHDRRIIVGCQEDIDKNYEKLRDIYEENQLADCPTLDEIYGLDAEED